MSSAADVAYPVERSHAINRRTMVSDEITTEIWAFNKEETYIDLKTVPPEYYWDRFPYIGTSTITTNLQLSTQ